MEIPPIYEVTYHFSSKGSAMAESAPKRLMLENVRLIFKNFAGVQSTFNPEGSRNFCAVLPLDQGKELQEEGWHVRWSEGRDEDGDPTPYLPIAVSYKNYPPIVTLVTSKGKTVLTEEQLDMLDWADIVQADIVVRPYDWAVGDKSGRKAYLKSAYFTIEEDELADKYESVPSTRAEQAKAEQENAEGRELPL